MIEINKEIKEPENYGYKGEINKAINWPENFGYIAEINKAIKGPENSGNIKNKIVMNEWDQKVLDKY